MSNSLPTTSYIKMIDVWMIFTMLYPFFVVSLNSLLEVLKNKKNNINIKQISDDMMYSEEKMNETSLKIVSFLLDWGLPIMFTVFIGIFWALGLANYATVNVGSFC